MPDVEVRSHASISYNIKKQQKFWSVLSDDSPKAEDSKHNGNKGS
jgi:hypothetical protein